MVEGSMETRKSRKKEHFSKKEEEEELKMEEELEDQEELRRQKILANFKWCASRRRLCNCGSEHTSTSVSSCSCYIDFIFMFVKKKWEWEYKAVIENAYDTTVVLLLPLLLIGNESMSALIEFAEVLLKRDASGRPFHFSKLEKEVEAICKRYDEDVSVPPLTEEFKREIEGIKTYHVWHIEYDLESDEEEDIQVTVENHPLVKELNEIQSTEEANRTLFLSLSEKLQDTDLSLLPCATLINSSASDTCKNVVEERVTT